MEESFMSLAQQICRWDSLGVLGLLYYHVKPFKKPVYESLGPFTRGVVMGYESQVIHCGAPV
jgi:hypothetical protein